jgi:hypothetical protein
MAQPDAAHSATGTKNQQALRLRGMALFYRNSVSEPEIHPTPSAEVALEIAGLEECQMYANKRASGRIGRYFVPSPGYTEVWHHAGALPSSDRCRIVTLQWLRLGLPVAKAACEPFWPCNLTMAAQV